MKISNQIPKSKQKEEAFRKTLEAVPEEKRKRIAERIRSLRKEHGYSQEHIAEYLGVALKTYQWWEGGKLDKKYGFYYPSIDYVYLCTLSDLFKVSTDFLLCRSDFKTPEKDFIGKYTGLSDESIESIIGIKKESENWKRNASIANTSPGYNDTDALNKLLKYEGLFTNILRGFQNLLNHKYTVPVHIENGKVVAADKENPFEYMEETFGFPGSYWLNLARSDKDLTDIVPYALDASFFRSVALKEIENAFLTLQEIYNKK